MATLATGARSSPPTWPWSPSTNIAAKVTPAAAVTVDEPWPWALKAVERPLLVAAARCLSPELPPQPQPWTPPHLLPWPMLPFVAILAAVARGCARPMLPLPCPRYFPGSGRLDHRRHCCRARSFCFRHHCQDSRVGNGLTRFLHK